MLFIDVEEGSSTLFIEPWICTSVHLEELRRVQRRRRWDLWRGRVRVFSFEVMQRRGRNRGVLIEIRGIPSTPEKPRNVSIISKRFRL